MNKKKDIAKFRVQAFLWTVLLMVCAFFAGCTQEDVFYPGQSNVEGGEVFALLSVHTPQSTLPSAQPLTRNITESKISGIKVLVFEKSGNNYIFSYYVTGSGLSGTPGNQAQFKASLVSSDVPLKLMVLANSDEAFLAASPPAGTTEAVVRRNLNESFSSTGLQGDIPMYGEILLPDGLKSSETYAMPVTVLRSIARIDVIKDLMDDATDFILEEVYAFRANDKIQLIPESVGDVSSPKVTTPSVPETAAHLSDPIQINIPNGAESITGLYLPESKKAENNAEKINGTTTIVVGGRYGGENKPITYYRLDLNSGLDGHPFGQILRNYRYIFKIKNVSSEGWSSPEDAANNVSSSMIVDIQTWEDFSTEMYLGDNRLGLSHRDISLRYVKNRNKTIDVESTLQYKIQWLDEQGNPTGSSTSDLNTVISNENFEVSIVKNPDDSQYITHLVFRTLNNNYQGNIITNKLRVTAERWMVDITVKQDNVEMYSNRYFNVLSVQEVGDLGTTLASEASGEAMRRLIDKQFVPGGVLKIGGFAFTRIPNNTLYIGATAPVSVVPMTRVIGAHDVIYLPNNTSISAEITEIILKWLEADDHRVLIVGTDSGSTNVILRNKLTDDGTWVHSNVGTITGSSFKRAPATAETDDFFDGPFGQIPENATFKKNDNTAGYNYSYPASVTPLMVSDKASYANYMFFGVNKSRRIIYHGDAQLFQNGQMSNISGNVTTDLDRFMANTWAWIAEQLIYGNN